jgi:prefoldin subunit 1
MSGDKKASSTGGPDLELKRAFVELQSKMVETKQNMRLADLQIENLKRNITHAGLTETEISALPEETRVFESVGRVFMLSNRTAVKETLEVRKRTCTDKIASLESNKEYLERSLKESENSLRELITQKKNSVGATA